MHPPRVHSAPSLLSYLFSYLATTTTVYYLPRFLYGAGIEWTFRENRDFIEQSRSARPSSSVIGIVFRIARHPVSVRRADKWGHDDIILHVGRSDIKSHLRDSPLPVTYLTFHYVYNGFLSRGIVQRYCSGNGSKW